MPNGILGGIPYHSWPCPAHHLTYLLTLFRRITVSRAVLASSLVFTILTMIKTATNKVSQMLVFIRHCILMKMMAAKKSYHLADSLFLSLNSVHSIRPHFISSPCLSYCLRLPTGGSIKLMRTTVVRSRLRAMASSNASMW